MKLIPDSVWSRALVCLSVLIIIAVAGVSWLIATRDAREYSHVVFQEHCSSCHGSGLAGTATGPGLLGDSLKFGDDETALLLSISGSIAAHNAVVLPEDDEKETVRALALYILERRQQYPPIVDSYLHTPEGQSLDSEHYRFKLEKFSALASRPYAIAPLPDGRILVSEKERGLTVIDKSGQAQTLIKGTPPAYKKFMGVQGSHVGWGQFLDVALHPDYARNGWIYLSFGDRCRFDCFSLVPQSMVKVVRARLNGSEWTDEELIWSVDRKYYTMVPDGVAGGRLGFDKDAYLYITVGGKAAYKHLHDMNTPYGKVHRVKDDGMIPEDNPFWISPEDREGGSTRHTVWSYGHRTQQGLEGHPLTGEIWNAEMGPRGGDEINKILGGENYGWPLYTNGLNYNSKEISIGEDLGLDFPIEATQLPIVDFTPAPAVSNITFYTGDVFPNWKYDLLVGSLKAMSLYRLRIENDKLIEKERLVPRLGRIRDVATGADGLIYIAVEHGDVGSIFRIAPLNASM